MRVVVGRIGKPHGLRGQVTVELRTDEPDERFAQGSVLFADGAVGKLTVAEIHWHSGRLLVSFVGYESRSAAESLRGTMVEVERDEAASPTEQDEYYDSALIGCRVETLRGELVGLVDDVVHLPSQELLSVVTATGREVLIPFVSQIVPTVDLANRRILIDPPIGLIEEPADAN
ncbi:MAG: ribosome maturation factor RimM [Candidatus Nanopelagicales bacterium]|nr:ribosome maturation factor RimM [Candidatus Nanopelagicales bacterium]